MISARTSKDWEASRDYGRLGVTRVAPSPIVLTYASHLHLCQHVALMLTSVSASHPDMSLWGISSPGRGVRVAHASLTPGCAVQQQSLAWGVRARCELALSVSAAHVSVRAV
jgi:hypothetical protein